MSLRAPFVDAAKAIDQVNPNIFVSYYPYGAVVALALDLQLRQRYPGCRWMPICGICGRRAAIPS